MELKTIVEKHGDKLLKKKNVVGYSEDPQKRIKGGVETDEEVFRIYVSKKEPISILSGEDVVPKTIDSVPTDIVEIGKIEPMIISDKKKSRTDKWRPIPGGVSIGNIKITAGTKSLMVRGIPGKYKEEYGKVSGSVDEGEITSLSNGHVYCENPTKDVSKQERRIAQPGPYDDQNWQNNIVGELRKEILIQPDGKNWADAALCKPSNTELDSNEILGIGVPTGMIEWKDISVGMRVWKSGRSSEITRGEVTDKNATVKVSYGEFTATFYNQCITTKILSPGDSGSAILKEDTKIVIGLGFAGSDSVSIFTPIDRILYAFGVELITKEEEPIYDIHVIIGMEKENGGEKKSVLVETIDKDTEEPIKDVYVDFENQTSGKTDANGKFATELPAGEYTLRCTKEGYKQVVKTIKIP